MPVRSSKTSPGVLSPTSQRLQPENETDLNRLLREVIRKHGLQVLHLRETDLPGATDLVIWDGIQLMGWMELKMEDGHIRPSQREFMAERRKETDRVYVGTLQKNGWLEICRWPDLDRPLQHIFYTDFRSYPWQEALLDWSGRFLD